jgi:hypothetical protein
MYTNTALCDICEEPRQRGVTCYCDMLPCEDWDHCEACNPKHPRVSVGRTHPLYDIDDGDPLDRIELISDTAYWNHEFNWHQRNVMRWAIRKCRVLGDE